MISEYQFDAPDADLILISGDSNASQFRIHSCILATASPFFHDLFSLPQPSHPHYSLPLVPCSEDGATLDSLLRFIYPVLDPQLGTLDDLVSVLAAAVKYECESVIITLRKKLVGQQYLAEFPLRVYAIATRYEFEEEAKIASQSTLKLNLLGAPLPKEFQFISATWYHRLLLLHQRRASGMQELLKPPLAIRCSHCNATAYTAYALPKWWHEFARRAKEDSAGAEGLFSMRALARIGLTGCDGCPESLLNSLDSLEEIKRKMEELPCMIEIERHGGEEENLDNACGSAQLARL